VGSPRTWTVTVARQELHGGGGAGFVPWTQAGRRFSSGDERGCLVFGGRRDDFDGVPLVDDGVGEGFDFGGCNDVGDGPEIWVGGWEGGGVCQGGQKLCFEGASRRFGRRRMGTICLGSRIVGRFSAMKNARRKENGLESGAGVCGLLGKGPRGIADVIATLLGFRALVNLWGEG